MHGMSGDVETGSTRPRPLSGGFWTLLSWLRGEEHSSSSDSISSAGSDRTTVSFAFLAPAHYQGSAAPLALPPPGPPTDSYKKRVHERNLRRHYDRDTTLHRKYGLFRGEVGVGLDVHSLPPTRRAAAATSDRFDRERRATSECFQHRVAHVPGKRRAPPPPTGRIINETSSLNRRHSRKRPAPPPPCQGTSKENSVYIKNSNIVRMNPQTSRESEQFSNSAALGCKPEKYTKKELNSKDAKVKTEKSFLKQIFENKKRNSSLDTSAVKILPNISELDKQAAEIIEASKIKRSGQLNLETLESSHNEKVWYCIKCSKKYDRSIDTCLVCKIKNRDLLYSTIKEPTKNVMGVYTQTDKDLPTTSHLSKNKEAEDKQKLKEMLKEIKDSLPKRSKLNDLPSNSAQTSLLTGQHKAIVSVEAPTLRVGTHIDNNIQPSQEPIFVCHQIHSTKTSENNVGKISPQIKNQKIKEIVVEKTNVKFENTGPSEGATAARERKVLNTPLKISSLLNPIYIPKANVLMQDQLSITVPPPPKELNSNNPTKLAPADPIYVKTADAVRNILLNTSASSSSKPFTRVQEPIKANSVKVLEAATNSNHQSEVLPNNTERLRSELEQLNAHSRRRELVNQLEKSIASGNEQAAADAASKLAQLRLSCSVLSFTSQILEQPSTSASGSAAAHNITASNGNETGKPSPFKCTKILECTKDDVQPPPQNTTSKETEKIITAENSSVFEDKEKGEQYIHVNNTQIKHTPNEENKPETSPDKVVLKKSESDISSREKNKHPLKSDVATQSNYIKIVSAPEKLSQPSTSNATSLNNNDIITISIWIEDKTKARGPIPMKIGRKSIVSDLRRQAEQTLGLPARLQRWIVGRELCCNDDTTLASLAGPNLDAPFYLCLVEYDKTVEEQLRGINETTNKIVSNNVTTTSFNESPSNVYTELVKLESQAAVPNAEEFECEICMEHCCTGDGVVLRECVHSFCRECLADVIRHCGEAAVSCPAMGCPGLLHEREIRALVNADEYARWLDRGLAAAESGTRNAFHCRTRDCTGWAFCEAGVRRFPCPVCKHTNCVPCQAIHDGETCAQYRTKLKDTETLSATNQKDEGTQALIESLISRGEALQCPECSVIITKKWGCDWVKCSACKTEICWVTRGRRWGAGGRGDTSGGCKCGLEGKRCHPSCGYCH